MLSSLALIVFIGFCPTANELPATDTPTLTICTDHPGNIFDLNQNDWPISYPR